MSRPRRTRLLVLVGSVVVCSLSIGPATATEAGLAMPGAAPPRVATPPLGPQKYSLPRRAIWVKRAIWVSNSRQLRAALARNSKRDIVLRPGVYDNAGPFLDARGNRL